MFYSLLDSLTETGSSEFFLGLIRAKIGELYPDAEEEALPAPSEVLSHISATAPPLTGSTHASVPPPPTSSLPHKGELLEAALSYVAVIFDPYSTSDDLLRAVSSLWIFTWSSSGVMALLEARAPFALVTVLNEHSGDATLAVRACDALARIARDSTSNEEGVPYGLVIVTAVGGHEIANSAAELCGTVKCAHACYDAADAVITGLLAADLMSVNVVEMAIDVAASLGWLPLVEAKEEAEEDGGDWERGQA